MSSRRLWPLTVWALATLASGRLSRADLAPRPGYVEACAVEKVQKSGEYCSSCPAWFGDSQVCERTFGTDKLKWTQRCRTSGASVWNEVWCTPWKDKQPPTVPAPKPKEKSEPAKGSGS